jgi:aminoglycoside/choline kinase family phosphotransferase
MLGSVQNSTSPGDQFLAFIGEFLKDLGFGSDAFEWHPIPADGSQRRFFRIVPSFADRTFIAMKNEPADNPIRCENSAYLLIGRHLREKGLPLPQIHAHHLDEGWFIMEDFGDNNLQQVASREKDRVSLYKKVVEILIPLQIRGSRGFNPAWTCQTKTYDAFVMRRYEADYFRDAFLCSYLGIKKGWPELEDPFNHLAEKASLAEKEFFLHRDFQSRNIMVFQGRIGVLDWQGGRLGPLAYDLSSLLIDPYTNLSEEEKGGIYRYYVELLKDELPGKVDSFTRSFPYLALQRNLQILGAFSFLTQVRKKTHFKAYIAPALSTLRRLLLDLNEAELYPLTNLVLSLDPEGQIK